MEVIPADKMTQVIAELEERLMVEELLEFEELLESEESDWCSWSDDGAMA
jgi:hypothetical protein